MSIIMPSELARILAPVLNVLLTVTMIAVVALIAARLALRRHASARYLLCLLALICILLAPLAVGILSSTHFGLFVFKLQTAAAPQAALPEAVVAVPSTNTPSLSHEPIWWESYALLSIWVLGILWSTARLGYGWRTMVKLRKTIQPLTDSALDCVLEKVQRTLGSPAPPILESKSIVSPVAIGLWKPVVILPVGLTEALTPTQLRHILLHECAHVTFRHAFGGVVQRLAHIVYWPHPLVSILCRELGQAREEVCDDVASQEEGAACYARTLLAIAQGLSTAPHYTSALALLGQGISLEKRISGLLDPRRNRMISINGWKLGLVAGVMTFTTVFATAVRVTAQNSTAPEAIPAMAKATKISQIHFTSKVTNGKLGFVEAGKQRKAKFKIGAGQVSAVTIGTVRSYPGTTSTAHYGTASTLTGHSGTAVTNTATRSSAIGYRVTSAATNSASTATGYTSTATSSTGISYSVSADKNVATATGSGNSAATGPAIEGSAGYGRASSIGSITSTGTAVGSGSSTATTDTVNSIRSMDAVGTVTNNSVAAGNSATATTATIQSNDAATVTGKISGTGSSTSTGMAIGIAAVPATSTTASTGSTGSTGSITVVHAATSLKGTAAISTVKIKRHTSH